MPGICRERRVVLFVAGIMIIAEAAVASAQTGGVEGNKVRVLLTVDGSHDWAGKEPIFMERVKQAGGFELTKSGDLDEWLPERIKKYDLVIVHTTGGNLTDAQIDGLTRFLHDGGGLVGIHSATDSFGKSDRWWELIGGRFVGHGHGTFTVEIVDPWHPIMIGLSDFPIEDEDYQHEYHPNADVHVLARKKGDPRALAWTRKLGKGRLVYLANGHGQAAFRSREFQVMLLHAMYWASRRAVPGSGYIPLFDGTDLTHWNPAPNWGIENGLLVNKPVPGPSLQSKDTFDDFVIRLDWNIVPGGNSGLYIRSATEIQILDDFAECYKHIKPCQHAGSVYCNLPAKPGALKKAGEWNEMQVLARGKKVQVWLNGHMVVDGSFDETEDLKSRPMRGHFILQNYGRGGGLMFRDIEVKPLPPEEKVR